MIRGKLRGVVVSGGGGCEEGGNVGCRRHAVGDKRERGRGAARGECVRAVISVRA